MRLRTPDPRLNNEAVLIAAATVTGFGRGTLGFLGMALGAALVALPAGPGPQLRRGRHLPVAAAARLAYARDPSTVDLA